MRQDQGTPCQVEEQQIQTRAVGGKGRDQEEGEEWEANEGIDRVFQSRVCVRQWVCDDLEEGSC